MTALMTMNAERDALLISRLHSGSASQRESAYAEIYESLREPVLSLCLHLTQNAADAEDAVQDVFLAVHRAIGAFRGESKLSTWVFRIAVRAALNRKASSHRHRGEEVPEGAVHPQPDLESAVDAQLRAEQLYRAMDALSADHRTVLSLFAVRGLSHREIADILGIKEGTVWSRLHLARKRLAEELERMSKDTTRPKEVRHAERIS